MNPQETNKVWEDELRNLIDDVRAGMKDDVWIYKLIRTEKQKSYQEGKREVLDEVEKRIESLNPINYCAGRFTFNEEHWKKDSKALITTLRKEI